jgi:hypothetical protein
MEVSVHTLGYLFFRLAPLILVSYFAISSIFQQDLRGFVYIIGLVVMLAAVMLDTNSTAPGLIGLCIINILSVYNLIFNVNIVKIFNKFIDLLASLFKSGVIVVIFVILAIYGVFHAYELKNINSATTAIQTPATGVFSAIFLTIGGILDAFKNTGSTTVSEPDSYCMQFSFNGAEIRGPVTTSIYGFTYGYLMYFINKYDLISSTVPIVLSFPLLLLADIVFSSRHNCRPGVGVNVAAAALSILWGSNWGSMVTKTKNPSFYYFTGSNVSVCSVPTKGNFKCKYVQNGSKKSQ